MSTAQLFPVGDPEPCGSGQGAGAVSTANGHGLEARVTGREVRFVVYCRPQPQGSTRAFYVKKLGRAVVTSDNKKLKPYRQMVSETAFALEGIPKIAKPGAVAVELAFYLEKPVSVAKKRKHLVVKPDVDKLVRSTLDALAGILFDDDAQVVELAARKEYGMPERVEICVRERL